MNGRSLCFWAPLCVFSAATPLIAQPPASLDVDQYTLRAETLSQEQRQQYDAAVAQRAAFRRQFLVQSVIAAIDEKVLLTEQQRQQLAEAVEASLDGDSQTAIGNSMMNGIRRYALQLVSRVDDEKLKAILSEHQVKGLSSNTGVVHQIRANAVLVKPR